MLIILEHKKNILLKVFCKSIYAKYADRYICSSIKNNIWWEFKNHRWVRIEEGYTLKMALSEEFANEFNKEIADISIQITQCNGFPKEELIRKRDKLSDIVDKLMNNNMDLKGDKLKELKDL